MHEGDLVFFLLQVNVLLLLDFAVQDAEQEEELLGGRQDKSLVHVGNLVFFLLQVNVLLLLDFAVQDAEQEEELLEETFGRKLCRALKYTSASIVLLIVLVLLGIFLPFETSTLQLEMGQYFEARWTAFKTEEGLFETIVFLMNSLRYYLHTLIFIARYLFF